MTQYKKSMLICLALFVSIFALSVGSAVAAPAMTLKFAGQSPADHPASVLMNEIAKEVAAKTKGRIEVKIYPANQLGDYTLVYEELIKGTIDMSCTSVPSQFDPRLELVYINGFVKGYGDVKKVFAPTGWLFKKMDELNTRLGVKLGGFFVVTALILVLNLKMLGIVTKGHH